MMRHSTSLSLALALSLAACGGGTDPGDAGTDAALDARDAAPGPEDASTWDSGLAIADTGPREIDASTPDDAYGADGGPACDPEGTWSVDWRPSVTNPADCETPLDAVQLGSDGLSASGLGHCAMAGCNVETCSAVAATASDCTSRVHVVAPCNTLPVGQTLDTTFAFAPDGTLMAATTLTRGDASTCRFEGLGTR